MPVRLLDLANAEFDRLNRPHRIRGRRRPGACGAVRGDTGASPRARRDVIGGAVSLVTRHIRLVALDSTNEDYSAVEPVARSDDRRGKPVSDRSNCNRAGADRR